MGKSKILAAVLATSMAFSSMTAHAGTVSVPGTTFNGGNPTWVWAIFGCAGGVVFTAMVANWQQNRQLTAAEAATCGILFWFTPPKTK